MAANFIKLSTLMIVLFCNETAFGMISSNTPNSPLNFFSQGMDFVKAEIIPLLSGSDRLNLRLTCTMLANNQLLLASNQFFYKIFNQYNNKTKQIAASCAFLHCIKEKKYQEVEWFLKNEIHNPLFNISYTKYTGMEYLAINPFKLIEANDLQMKELFATYHYDEEKFVKSLKKIQEKHCEPVKLNKKLQKWQCASNNNSILGEIIDPTSNIFKNRISEKEYAKKKLCFLIKTDCSSQLILAACSRDIKCFDKVMIDYNKNNNISFRSKNCTMLLSIFAAFKNKDLDFIKCILKQPFYIDNMKSNIFGLLPYFLLNTPVENSADLKISNDKCFENKHIQWIKQLIQEGMFTAIPTMIENNKDNNKHIKEIYETLNQKLIDQKAKENEQKLDKESTK